MHMNTLYRLCPSDRQCGSMIHLFPVSSARALRFARLRAILVLGAAFAALLPAAARAQETPATGVVTGRVQNILTNDYLTNARVVVESAGLETFTNRFGEYRLADVPAGEVTLRAFYTGLEAQSRQALVPAQGAVKMDFNLGSLRPATAAADETVVLEEYVTSARREMDPFSLAVNEQRYAASLRNVVSADQFGDVTEGNIGEFVKFLPGISVDYTAADARTISVRGLPSSRGRGKRQDARLGRGPLQA